MVNKGNKSMEIETIYFTPQITTPTDNSTITIGEYASGGWYCRRCGTQLYLPELFCVYCLEELKNDIGDELFNRLSDEDKRFILETEGIVDFRHKVDLDEIQRIIKNIEDC
jgi:hypothetical protein